MLAIHTTYLTESGSVYAVAETFGVTTVTRTSGHGVDGVIDAAQGVTQTQVCDSVEPFTRWSPSRGDMVDALLIRGGAWDRVITAPIVATDAPAMV